MPFTRHGTLTANTAKAVTIPDPDAAASWDTSSTAAVLHVTGTEPIYMRGDGTTATIQGDDTYTVPPGARRSIRVATVGQEIRLSLISAADATYEVEVD